MSFITSKKYLAMTLDPLHIGSGAMQLGKVDNPITLDPATHIPKIPGTGLSGAVKYFTDLALLYLYRCKQGFDVGKRKPGKHKNTNNQEADNQEPDKQKQTPVWCASTRGECGNGCMVCYTFGYSTRSGQNSKGVLSFCDAHIVLFPVYSAMYGRVWITCPSLYHRFFSVTGQERLQLDQYQVKVTHGLPEAPLAGRIEIGGCLLHQVNGKLQPLFGKWFDSMGLAGEESKIMVVADALFGQLVARNLEHRTSVAIDPETGAAKDGALFTFEAVPTQTFFEFAINSNEYKQEVSPFAKVEYQKAITSILQTLGITSNDFGPFELIQLGFQGIEQFGMGGMNTRGFGRIKINQR